jgi:tetratricopeptide (TPR) repeat protein
MILMARDQFKDALEPFEQARELCLDMESSWHLATSHLNLGMAKMHAGDLEAAESSILNAREMYSQIGDEHFEARCLGYRGYTALLAGDMAHAKLSFTNSLEAFRDLEDLQGIAEAFEGLSAVCAVGNSADSAVKAARCAGAAESVRETLTAKQYPFDKAGLDPYLAKGRAAIGDQEWEQARQAGREMLLEEAIELALHA